MTWVVENYVGQDNTPMIQLMAENGYSIRALAKDSGVSPKALWSMLNGCTYPRLDTILLVAHTLNCTIDDLYPMDYNKSNPPIPLH